MSSHALHTATEFLEFGFVTDKTSIFERIKKVPPATYLKFSAGNCESKNYWQLNRKRDSTIKFEEAVEETERRFLDAVEKRLFADVPVGALLSGGIDSSLVCWAVSRLGGDVTAFTVGVPGDDWDETEIAASTAKQLAIDHKVLKMSGEVPLDISILANAYGEPFASASALGLIDISREVRKHATVLLTGDGGDDVYLGYPEHYHFKMAGTVARSTPAALGEVVRELSVHLPSSGQLKRIRSFLSYAFGGLGGVTRARDGLPFYRKAGLLGPKLLEADIPDRHLPLTHGKDLLEEFLVYDLGTRFTGEYLTKVDGGTMFHALEARSPFLDSQLWEFASTIPFSIRLRNGESKAVLREIARRRIGPELASAKKKGFGVPVQRWLTGDWKSMFLDSLSGSRVQDLGLIDTKRAIAELERAGDSNWAPRQLWFILVLENWLRFEGI